MDLINIYIQINIKLTLDTKLQKKTFPKTHNKCFLQFYKMIYGNILYMVSARFI